jgi:hypothetical protein
LVFSEVLVWIGVAQSAHGDGATRDLPDYYVPGAALTVSITIEAPVGTLNVLLEDLPPTGWTAVGNISDGGWYDAGNHKVKWGPFFDDLSRTIAYDLTPPGGAAGEHCFAGSVMFDMDPAQPVEGDDCIAIAVPTLAEWGLVVMGLLLVTAGTIAVRQHGLPRAG